MLKIYDLYENYTEDQVDDFIERQKGIPTEELTYSYDLNNVVEDDPRTGSFYLAENDRSFTMFNCHSNVLHLIGSTEMLNVKLINLAEMFKRL